MTVQSENKGSVLNRWAADDRGNVAMIFVLCGSVILGTVGGAVDYGRALNVRTQMQSALDAAVLSATRVSQTTSGNTSLALKAGADTYASMRHGMQVDGSDTLTITPTDAATVFTGHAEAKVKTPFLSFVGLKEYNIGVESKSKMVLGEGGTNIEISLMLDITGSMCNFSGGQYMQPCDTSTKLTAMRTAVHDLVDIVVWDDQTKFSSKIAIAPFSNSVNVGSYFTAVTGKPISSQVATGQYNYPSSCYTTTYNKKGQPQQTLLASCLNNPKYAVYKTVALAPCVNERTGAEQYTDTSPGGLSTWLPTWNSMSGASGTVCPNATQQSPNSNSILPLTNDKTLLKAKVDHVVGSNGTAGFLGTSWAWYLISPNWDHVFTGGSAPLPYSLLAEKNDNGSPKLKKIAILMTDGAYNTYQYGQNDSNNGAKAVAMCQAMKAKGIIVYTIGFDLSHEANAASAIDTLTKCSSSGAVAGGATDVAQQVGGFFNAQTPAALQSAFRQIALEVSTLRITN
jgi:Flp pilus assembly protein TadG